MKTVEYKIREVTRYVVTRFVSEVSEKGEAGSCSERGEFDNPQLAAEIASACALADERLGFDEVSVSREAGPRKAAGPIPSQM